MDWLNNIINGLSGMGWPHVIVVVVLALGAVVWYVLHRAGKREEAEAQSEKERLDRIGRGIGSGDPSDVNGLFNP